MSPFVVALGIAGVILILVGLVGGGFTISTTAMPNPPQPPSPVAVVSTAAPTSPPPTDNSQGIAKGTIYAPVGYSTIYVYSEPSQNSSVVASIADGITTVNEHQVVESDRIESLPDLMG